MKKILVLALSLALIPVFCAAGGPPAAKQSGIEAKDYKWNAQEGEKIEALKLKGNAKVRKAICARMILCVSSWRKIWTRISCPLSRLHRPTS